jgi:putative SOS response-associated peptidase YedK
MCNRYVPPGEGDIERFWEIGRGNPIRWPGEIFPRAPGPFIRATEGNRELVVGQWGLIPWFAKTAKLTYSTNNARFEEITDKASYKWSWLHGIPTIFTRGSRSRRMASSCVGICDRMPQK